MPEEPEQRRLWQVRGEVTEADLAAWLGAGPDGGLECPAWVPLPAKSPKATLLALFAWPLLIGALYAAGLTPVPALLLSGLLAFLAWLALRVERAPSLYGKPRSIVPPRRHGRFVASPQGLWLVFEGREGYSAWDDLRACRGRAGRTWTLVLRRGEVTLQPSHEADAIARVARQVLARQRWYLRPLKQVEFRPEEISDAAVSLVRLTGDPETDRSISLASEPDDEP